MSVFLFDAIKQEMDKAVKDKPYLFNDANKYEEYKKELQDELAVEMISQLMDNNGYISLLGQAYGAGSKKVNLKDELITTPQFKELFPKVVTKIVMEAQEPNLVLTSMLEEIKTDAIQAVAPIISGYGGKLDVPEGGEPQSFTVSTGGFKTYTMGKSGILVKFSDEVYESLDYSVLQYVLRQAGSALGRWKELKVADMLQNIATDVKTGGSGVDASNTQNASLTFDDILEASVNILNNGGIADTIILNPLAFPIFLQNPTLRSLFLMSQGDMGSMWNWEGINTVRTTEEALKYFRQKQKAGIKGANFPGGLFGKGLNVVLSEFVPYNPSTKKADVMVLDSSHAGFLAVKQLPTTTKFEDPLRGLKNFKIIERYSVVPMDVPEPEAKNPFITRIKDVAVVKGFDPSL